MLRIRDRIRRAPAAAVLLALLVSVPSYAQQASSASPAAAKSAEPVAIPAALIPEQADLDERFALAVTARATPFDASGALARQLTDIQQGIRSLRTRFRSEQLAELTAPRLDSLDHYWDLYDRRLAQWEDKVQTITNRYSADAADLTKRRAIWEATLDPAAAGDLAPALGDRAREIIEQLRSAQESISEPLETAIAMGRQGNQVHLDLASGRDGLNAAIATYTRRLYMIDMLPLWEQGWSDSPTHTAAGDVEITFIGEYFRDRYRQLRAFGIAWLASLPLFLWLSRRERHRAGAEASPVLHRPISAWLLLGSMLAPILFHSAPVALTQLALLLGLIPVLRLLPQAAFKILRWLPYAVVALYFLHRLRVFIWDDPLLYRIHLLAIDAIAASITVWLLGFKHSQSPLLKGNRRAFVRMIGSLAVGALIVAFIANIVGNVSLAEMLTNGVLESTYIALAIYAALSALLAIGAILIRPAEGPEAKGFFARNIIPLLSALRTPMKIGALLLWIVVTINEFQIYRPTAEWLTAALTKPLAIGELEITLGGILLFFLAVWLALLVARTARMLLMNEVLSGMRLPPGVANSVSSLTYYALVFVGLLAALAASGFEMSQFTLILGALGVGIGLGLQNVVGNFVSGLILMFERPIRPGDVVEVGGTNGRVREIGMRATTLQTFEGADVVVPNGTLLQANLINWTLNNTNRRVNVEVGVSYSADPPAVQMLLAEVARGIPGVSTDPSPVVLFVRFNNSSIDFSVRAWTNDFDNWLSIQSALGVAVHRALKDAGIEIPFPQQDLHLRSMPDIREGTSAVKPAAEPGQSQ